MNAAKFLEEAAHAFAAEGIDIAGSKFVAALNNLAMAVAADHVEIDPNHLSETTLGFMERAIERSDKWLAESPARNSTETPVTIIPANPGRGYAIPPPPRTK